MFVDQQLTYNEIALLMRISVAKVKALIHDARCRLRDHFDEELDAQLGDESSERGEEP
jgi:DNA-directed RNA polymerase specialized sigma24 family protein